MTIDEPKSNHNKPWDGASMNQIENLFDEGLSLAEISLIMGRTKNAISSRLVHMNLVVNRMGLLFKVDRMAWADNRTERSKGREL